MDEIFPPPPPDPPTEGAWERGLRHAKEVNWFFFSPCAEQGKGLRSDSTGHPRLPATH